MVGAEDDEDVLERVARDRGEPSGEDGVGEGLGLRPRRGKAAHHDLPEVARESVPLFGKAVHQLGSSMAASPESAARWTWGPSASRPAAIVLRDFTLAVPGRTLLEGVNLEIPAGGIALIVGPSGAGKSVLLDTLAGLGLGEDRPVTTGGQLLVEGEDVTARRGRSRVGLVFQQFALLDELGVEENIHFGRDHCPASRRPAVDRVEELITRLDLPRKVPTGLLSGGQKQRLALARTLASSPDIVVYDEPTSGLDPASADRVAQTIREAWQEHGKTTLIVTHDYEHLQGIAQEIYLLDPSRRTLEPVPTERAGSLPEVLRELGAPAPSADTPDRSSSSLRSLVTRPLEVFTATGRALEALLLGLLALLPRWPSPAWGLRYLRHFGVLLLAPSSLAYFAAAGLIAGLVSTHFTFKFLPSRPTPSP